tara:strand:+ start:3219 stop:5471 length:2253 start_codon:yes stop_codon:yes gene_type:complete
MPTYGDENFKESNVNYLNKDFSSLKDSLMNYAKSYFPDTYQDFNETSPGMMLLEMNAYVGDVLSFYIDQQYKEMLLPLSTERRNVINMAKMFGYKVKPIIPSYTTLTFSSEVTASTADRSKVNYSDGGIFDLGIEIESNASSDIVFTTIEHIDFQISQSNDTDSPSTFDDSGLVTSYTLSRDVKAISAKEKTISFQIGSPEKFKKLTIPDTDVIDIISCVDSNGNNWYEVDFLAQDQIPIKTHYTDDINRPSAYSDATGLVSSTAVPFSLTYKTTTKRFTRETNINNTTSLIFGNGVLKNGYTITEEYIDMEQLGITIPGQTSDLNDGVDPLLGDFYSTLGETPNNTTLTITYRVGGGVSSNVPAGNISTTPTLNAQNGNTSAVLTSVINDSPAIGGRNQEEIIEIKEKARAFFATQNRCVTKEDYEARILHMDSQYGGIAKVYVTRDASYQPLLGGADTAAGSIVQSATTLSTVVSTTYTMLQDVIDNPDTTSYTLDMISGNFSTLINNINNVSTQSTTIQNFINQFVENPGLTTINIYCLSYNSQKQLVGNPHADSLGVSDSVPQTLLTNTNNYLQNFKMLTDTLTFNDGYVVNFGVIFDVIAERYVDKQKVKLDCIQKIKDYFRIEKMQFNQPIYKSKLEYELMGVEGVRSVGHITLTQDRDYFYDDMAGNSTGEGEEFNPPLYTYSYRSDGETFEISQAVGYGYKYDFSLQGALSDDKTIIIPPQVSTPTVFELKFPDQNIIGRVR